MPRLLVPIEKEFSIIAKGLTEDDPIVVSFRQATEAMNLRRQELLAKPVTRSWENDSYQEQLNFTPFGRRMAIDVWLTMTACNIEKQNGDPLFTFQDLNSHRKITDKTLDEFLKKWGQLAPEWAEAIYDKCLLVNPSWGFGPPNEDEDTLTPEEKKAEETAGE